MWGGRGAQPSLGRGALGDSLHLKDQDRRHGSSPKQVLAVDLPPRRGSPGGRGDRPRRIPVTTVPRTVFDLAATSSIDVVESAIRQVEYLRLYDRLSLVDMIDRYPGRRGVRRVRAALARIEKLPTGHTKSRLEEKFLPFLRRYGLPRPRLNDWITVGEKRFQADCHWYGTGQIVELDSWEGHGTRSAFREDRARDRILGAAGYVVTRISWAQLDDEPEAVASDLRKLLARS